jgi:hypothetical protein
MPAQLAYFFFQKKNPVVTRNRSRKAGVYYNHWKKIPQDPSEVMSNEMKLN